MGIMRIRSPCVTDWLVAGVCITLCAVHRDCKGPWVGILCVATTVGNEGITPSYTLAVCR